MTRITDLAGILRDAELRSREGDERSARASRAGNIPARDHFEEMFKTAFDDVCCFTEAITRFRAETVEDAGLQLSIAVRLYEMLVHEVEGTALQDLRAIGRVLYSAVFAIEAATGKDLSAGVREDRLSPWRYGQVDAEHEECAA